MTNDDGVDAPALPVLARLLAAHGEVRVVAPDQERSWIGKAITRFDPVRVTEVERGGVAMLAVSGFPADCVQLAAHVLFDSPPALVVSGINLGYNHGGAYVASSGTIGAALEGGIAGIPSLAASAGTLQRPWAEWRPWAETSESLPMWERLGGIVADLAGAMLEAAPPGLVVSANVPDDADLSTERRRTTVAPVAYDRLFGEQEPGVFVHAYAGGLQEIGPMEGSDIEAAMDGVVSISAIRGIGDAAMDEGLSRAMRIG